MLDINTVNARRSEKTKPVLVVKREPAPSPAGCTSARHCGGASTWVVSWPTQRRWACDTHIGHVLSRAIDTYGMAVKVKA